ncbi:MAG: aminoacyl-tRNA hydrolase [Candidatus Omnitrophota bacterium]|nr:aminoacyl-tRNA hydrolase [Candidatus Omnitrophota bacterium]
MKLIVGLGNPGILYASSRHNIGFQAVKYLAKVKKIALKKEKGIRALSAKAKIEGMEVVLAIPLTFMNLSGEAVRQLIKKYKIDLGDLLVVCDDLDLEFGRLKIRSSGSSAGHRGVKSIIDALGSDQFSRLRIGIGRPEDNSTAADYVLSRFNKREQGQLSAIIKKAAECCQVWVSEGIDKSMSIFNRNK